MLKSFCKGTAALALVLSFSAAAHAEEHVVTIADGSYFPNKVYASEGDMLTFVNQSSSAHTVTGEDDAWTSGVIETDASFSMELTDQMPAGFESSGSSEFAEGEIIFQ